MDIFEQMSMVVESAIDQQDKLKHLQSDASKIASEVEKYRDGGASGNQNCMLCTWSMELRCRGRNALPRPVYSPRDPIFKFRGYEIVKNGVEISPKDERHLRGIVQGAGPGSRFYIHVNWKNSTSGHEFLLCNIDREIFVVDAQSGYVSSLDNKETSSKYLNIDWSNSYVVRVDDRPIDESVWRYNDNSYLIQWDDAKDIPYLEQESV